MKTLLLQTYRFPERNIKVLTNKQATKHAVIEQLRWLARIAGPEDAVIFYFSGHGSRVPDTSGDEADGLDETIMPYDATDQADSHIIDDEIDLWLRTVSSRKITVIFDSCHSGTATKSRFLTKGFVFPKYRKLAAQSKSGLTKSQPIASGFVRRTAPDQEARNLQQIGSKWRGVWGFDPSIVKKKRPSLAFFYAAKAHQSALDIGGNVGSVFTHYFVQVTKQNKSATPREVIQTIHRNINTDSRHERLNPSVPKIMTPGVEEEMDDMLFFETNSQMRRCVPSSQGQQLCGEFYILDKNGNVQNKFKKGEMVRFSFRFNRTAYAVILNKNGKGQHHLLYPDMYWSYLQSSPSSNVYQYEGNKTHQLPPPEAATKAEIYVDGEVGEVETVSLIAGIHQSALSNITDAAKDNPRRPIIAQQYLNSAAKTYDGRKLGIRVRNPSPLLHITLRFVIAP